MDRTKTEPQLLIVYSAFLWFATVLELNKKNDIKHNDKLLLMFRTLARLSRCSKEKQEKRIQEINQKIVETGQVEVDYLLLSVTIVAELYSQTKGKRRFYSPLTHQQILIIQDEVLSDISFQMAEDTFDFAEQYVALVLKERC